MVFDIKDRATKVKTLTGTKSEIYQILAIRLNLKKSNTELVHQLFGPEFFENKPDLAEKGVYLREDHSIARLVQDEGGEWQVHVDDKKIILDLIEKFKRLAVNYVKD